MRIYKYIRRKDAWEEHEYEAEIRECNEEQESNDRLNGNFNCHWVYCYFLFVDEFK